MILIMPPDIFILSQFSLSTYVFVIYEDLVISIDIGSYVTLSLFSKAYFLFVNIT